LRATAWVIVRLVAPPLDTRVTLRVTTQMCSKVSRAACVGDDPRDDAVGDPEGGRRGTLLSHGAQMFVRKPFDPDMLLGTLQELLPSPPPLQIEQVAREPGEMPLSVILAWRGGA